MINNKYEGFWISIDGTEGVGKTEVAQYLQQILPGSIVAPEFSSSPIGSFLQNAVQTNPHFISESLLEQSLLFLADFFRIYDSIVLPAIRNKHIVISDRGYASKYVYQMLVLSSAFDPKQVKVILDSLFNMISTPSLSLLLTCNESTQIKRLIERDGHCDDDRIKFIRKANQEYVVFLQGCGGKYEQIEQNQKTTKRQLFYETEQLIRPIMNG